MTDPDHKPVSLRRGPVVIQFKGIHSLVVMGLVMILVTVGNVVYTLRVDSQSDKDRARIERDIDRRWCQLLVPLDEAYQTNPQVQSTDLGRRVAAAIHNIRVETGC